MPSDMKKTMKMMVLMEDDADQGNNGNNNNIPPRTAVVEAAREEDAHPCSPRVDRDAFASITRTSGVARRERIVDFSTSKGIKMV